MKLSDYFGKVWKGNIEKYQYSGLALITKVEPGDKVLDVGCGYHPFKNRIPNVYGIDPFNDSADEKVSIEEFTTDKLYDKIFCLGSINFGNETVIKKQIEKLYSLIKQDGIIYWRQNPGLQDHNNEECKTIDFYRWSFDKNIELARRYGFEVIFLAWDTDNRIYAEWKKI